MIFGKQRCVDDTRDPLAGITATYRNIAVDEADARDTAFHIVGILRMHRSERAG